MCFTWVGSALPTNIRLDWKGQPGTNALAYYEKSYLTAVKSFITLGTDEPEVPPESKPGTNVMKHFLVYFNPCGVMRPGSNVIKRFTSVIY
jgi:hypothetical protein